MELGEGIVLASEVGDCQQGAGGLTTEVRPLLCEGHKLSGFRNRVSAAG